ncbi:MAG: hypothetical protein ACTSU5_12870 [Promethearchaeota archaeon]
MRWVIFIMGPGTGAGATQAKKITRHGKKIDRLEDLMAQLVQSQLEQGRRLDEQGRRLDEQGRRLDEQGRRLDALSQQINESIRASHKEYVDLRKYMGQRFQAIDDQFQRLWENVDGRLRTLEERILKRLPPESMTA